MKSLTGFILYKIYYGDYVVYLGRTKQPLQSRLRGHFFAKPMHKSIDIEGVTRIEYAECKTLADMYLYEIYYINLLHPPLNCDDKAKDELTVTLPGLEWKPYVCPLVDKWKFELSERGVSQKAARQKEIERMNLRSQLRLRHKLGELSDEEYENLLEAEGF